MDRRCYIVSVDPESLRLFFGGYRENGQMSAVDFQSATDPHGNVVHIPDDYEIVHLMPDSTFRSIHVLIRHPSFPVVPLSQHVPELKLREFNVVLPVIVSDNPNINTDKVTVNPAA